MRTRKWSALLAAVIAMTGLSNITLAADYTTGLTGAYRVDNKRKCQVFLGNSFDCR